MAEESDKFLDELRIVYCDLRNFIETNCNELNPIETVKYISDSDTLSCRTKRLYCYVYGVLIKSSIDDLHGFKSRN
jgi:hypothetical protein